MNKVLMVLPRYIPIIGGAEVQCHRLIQELKKNKEIKVVGVVTRRVDANLSKNDCIDGVQIRRLPPMGTGIFSEYIFCVLLSLYLLLNYKKIDVIHCHASSIFGMTCSLIGGLLGKKVIVKISTNGEIKSMQNTRFKKKVADFSSRFCTYIALNQEGYEEASTFLKNPSIALIPNGIDFNNNHERDKLDGSIFREDLQKKFEDDIFVCVFVGRFVKRKGINELCRAAESMKEGNKKIIFVLVGDSELQRDAIQLDETLSENVVIVGRQQNIFPYLYAADLFISPSHQEGLPNTVLEALSVGTVCLLSDIRPHQQLFEEHKNKIHLFETGNASSLKSVLMQFVMAGTEKNRHRENYLLKKYSIGEVANQYFLLYKDRMNAGV
jgi:glycosyltransferase involved in cell wall biosynthesis